eukprot:scaffold12863_cov31-Tisochrysis_lutea.AAC.3
MRRSAGKGSNDCQSCHTPRKAEVCLHALRIANSMHPCDYSPRGTTSVTPHASQPATPGRRRRRSEARWCAYRAGMASDYPSPQPPHQVCVRAR